MLDGFMKLKVIIADDEHRICQMLARFIDCEALNLEIVDMASDGEELLSKIRTENPDIVITDICMPKESGMEVIRQAVQMGLTCKFIIISGFRQFDYAYTALKYDVSDYLLKPVDKNELNTALGKIAWQLRHKNESIPSGKEQDIHHYFILKGAKKLLAKPVALGELNTTYRTNFQKGLFQVILIRIDSIGKPRSIPENPASIHREVQNKIIGHLSPYCHDIIATREWDDIIAILNYPERNTESLQSVLYELFSVVKRNVEMFGGVTATLCIGSAYADINKIDTSKTEATDAAWKRMASKLGTIITAEAHGSEHQPSLEPTLHALEQRIQKAFETLNIKEYSTCIEELFSFPSQVISSSEVKHFVRSIPELFFEQHESTLAEMYTIEHIAKEIRYELRMVTSFTTCRSTLIRVLSGLMDEVRDHMYQRNTKPIRLAMDFVKSKYANPITLDDVASEVGLSSVYFSSIFKKETSQNFTDFLMEYRMTIAKNLLKSSNLSIKEIAHEVSFLDPRYFSKVFKKIVGIKPTDYKKIYS